MKENKGGRGKTITDKMVRVTVTLEPETLAAVDRQAAARGWSRSAVIEAGAVLFLKMRPVKGEKL